MKLAYLASVFYLMLGLAGLIQYGFYNSQVIGFTIPGLITYSAYPPSLIVFSIFGIILARLYGYRGIPLLGLCVFTWDVYGSLNQLNITPPHFWIFWACAITTCYVLSGKPRFDVRNYSVVLVLVYYSIGTSIFVHFGLGQPSEAIWEILWCNAFYHSLKQGKQKVVSNIETIPKPPMTEMLLQKILSIT